MSEQSMHSGDQQPENKGRRMLLLGATGGLGVIGAAFAAWPFIASWKPSARARVIGGPVEAYVGAMEPGQLLKIQWRGQTIGILRRTEEMLAGLELIEDRLRDPESEVASQQPPYAANRYRSLRPEYLVVNMHCTHLGCVPEYIPEVGPQPFEENWRGGFFCPCHKSKFDLAGRVYVGVPAPLNLLVPPYHFEDPEHVVIGVDPEGAA
ncbi:MAG: ubiquinol-cytochrome c reductase iron-sulfur subunit [Wenzhouxiangellaceae bacterium]